MKSVLSWIAAAAVAVVLVGLTDGGAEAASDPYWTTCAALADGEALQQTAAALTERVGLPALTAQVMVAELVEACDGRSPHYRPGLDAVRSALSGEAG